MTQPIITVENLSKAYRLGAKEETPDTLVGAAKSLLTAPYRNFRELSRLNTFTQSSQPRGNAVATLDAPAGSEGPSGDDARGDDRTQDDRTLWALKDVSFDVQEGEVVGIIGRNGAGKSTLLKILSRITEPTSGRATIRGRVSSLLEVGTGFHPELSGRDNVYMNGTILGMTKREIDRKFDEIVDFSGVEKFLDTPIKRYSSGMQVRLAFAVAAHLEPEILIVDEVLAVGDMEFQKKCLGKMKDVASGGRTVLFVSHNMAAVINLCSRGVLLNRGAAAFCGSISDSIGKYEASTVLAEHRCSDVSHYRDAWCSPVIESAKIVDDTGVRLPSFPIGSALTIELEFSSDSRPIRKPVMGLVFNHVSTGPVAAINTRVTGFSHTNKNYSAGRMRCTIPKLPLVQGRYEVDVWLGDGPSDLDVLKGYLAFDLEATDYYGSGVPPMASLGTVLLDASWDLCSL